MFNKIDNDKDIIVKELEKAENEIKEKFNNNFNIQNYIKQKYLIGLIDTKWLEKYLNFLKDNSNNNLKETISFSSKNILPKIDDKDYTYINNNMIFHLPINFSFVTKEAMDLISKYNNIGKEKNEIKNYLHNILIGKECIIKKQKGDFNDVANSSYIILYENNKNNNIDYILTIKNKEEREKALDYILKNSIWSYLKKINYNEEDEYKEIFDDENYKIGFIFRNGSLERIKELKNIEKKKNQIHKSKTINVKNFNTINNINNISCNNMNNINNNFNTNRNNFNNNLNININNCGNNINNFNINNKYNNFQKFNLNTFQSFNRNGPNNNFKNNQSFNKFENNNNNINDNDFEHSTAMINCFLKNKNKQNRNEEWNMKIIQLENELKKEKEEKKQEKEKNDNLNVKINNLEKELDKMKKKYEEKEKDNKKLKEELNKYKNNKFAFDNFIELMNELKIKEKKLNEIKSQLKFELNEGEKIMTVIFNSLDQQILHSFICKNTDKFTKLENLLYDLKEYKEYKKIENYFLVCGKKINKYETLEENGIKNNDIITLVRMVDK